MVREIIFRGKRKDNGEWVEGSYMYANSRCWIVDNGARFDYGELDDCEEVDPQTVGQFVGLVDRKDRKIFEGDIVKDPGVAPQYPGVYVVEFDYGSFGLRNITDGAISITPFDDSEYYIDAFSIEVIGNIHDNPELLEVSYERNIV